MELNISLMKVAAVCRPGPYESRGPWEHMSFFSTGEELRQGYGRPEYAKRRDYQAKIKRRLNIMGEMEKLETTVETAMKKLKRCRNKEKAFEKLPKKTKQVLKTYHELSIQVRGVWGPASRYVNTMFDWRLNYALR